MSFEVKQESFDGPLHLLLELIQKQELPITEVSLAQVAEGYLTYINEHTPPLEELADFLIVATKLLLIKSRAILPVDVEEEQEDSSTLALQLRLYKEFIEASEKIEELFDAPQISFTRMRADVIKPDEIQISRELTKHVFCEAFLRLLKRLEPFFRLQQAAIERVVSVKERLNEIHNAVLSRSSMTFSDVVGNGQSRVDVVVSFLALLELVKQRIVNVVQQDSFKDIRITRVD